MSLSEHIANAEVASPKAAAASNIPSCERPARLMTIAVLWFLAALAVSFVAAFLFALIFGIHNGIVSSRHSGQPWVVPPWLIELVAAGALQLALLLVALRRGRIVGHGDRRRGLGLLPLQRRRLLTGLLIAVIPIVGGWYVLLRHAPIPLPVHGVGELLTGVAQAPSALSVIGLLLVTGILAPVAEEWFFRGWLWSGLRQHWGAVPVACATSCLWLLAHLPESFTRPLFLLPIAVMLGVARHACGSVRAPLLLHLTNNLFFVGLGLFALLNRI